MTIQRVADVMTREVVTIGRDHEVHELEKLLLEQGVHGVPVVDDDGTLVGVVSQTDLLGWHYNSGVDDSRGGRSESAAASWNGMAISDIRTARVDEVMSPVVHRIRADRPLAVAAASMIQHGIHRLVVVDSRQRVEGVVSAIDVLRALPGVEPLLKQPAPQA